MRGSPQEGLGIHSPSSYTVHVSGLSWLEKEGRREEGRRKKGGGKERRKKERKGTEREGKRERNVLFFVNIKVRTFTQIIKIG